MKNNLKSCANVLSLLLILLPWTLYQLARLVLGERRSFAAWSEALSLIPGIAGVYLRRAFYRLALGDFGFDSTLGFGTVLSTPRARVGKRVYVGLFCSLGDAAIEDDALLSSHVSVINGGAQHGTSQLGIPIREQVGSLPRVTIGQDSWIGERAVIMADVGRHCVVGAGAVVVHPLPDYAVAVGVPARIIRYRDDSSASSSVSA
jgi:acetyltransferase-like isoleucine patch superfamily enzyme